MNIYIDKWIRRTDQKPWDVWDAPEYNSVRTRLELRSQAQKRMVSGDSGYGIFVYDNPVSLAYPLGDINDSLTSKKRVDIGKLLGVETPPDLPVGELLWWLFNTQGEPTGLERWRGFLPNQKLTMRMRLGDVIRREQYDPAKFLMVLPILQNDYRKLREACLLTDSKDYLKRLTVWSEKYKLPTEAFIPSDLPIEKAEPHDTVILDDFDRSNANPPGTATVATVSQGWAWADVEGDISLSGNVLVISASARGTIRAGSNLASDEHYSQAVITSTTNETSIGGVLIRKAANATMTCYVGYADFKNDTNMWRIVEFSGGTGTNRNTKNGNPASGSTFKLLISGTVVDFYQDATKECTYDDSASETGAGTLQVGLSGYRGSSDTITWNNFEGGDIAEEEGWANISKVNGVTAADMSKFKGVAVADISKVMGVAV